MPQTFIAEPYKVPLDIHTHSGVISKTQIALLGPVLTTHRVGAKSQEISFARTFEGNDRLFEKYSSCLRTEISL